MDQIEEIKSKVDIVDLIGEYIPLKKAGRNFKALCPFHHEKTPSFIVSPELQIFKCFGCGASGDVIKFLQLYERMDFWEAVEFLAKRVGITLKQRRYSPAEAERRRIYSLNLAASQFYHFLLRQHPLGQPARAYLQKRGLKKETIDRFQLGFSPQQGNALAYYLLKKKGFRRDDLLKSGLFFRTNYAQRGIDLFDRFHGRLVFPLYDHRGNIVSFSGRLIPNLGSAKNQGKYINGPETAAYHKSHHLFGLYFSRDAIRQAGHAIVVEGEFDFLSSWQAGVKNVVALKGTAFTHEQIQLLRRFSPQIKLALDSDFAGNQAALRSINLAENEGLEISVITLPSQFKDPDEIARQDPQGWQSITQQTIPVWSFIIDYARRRFGQQTPQAKKQILATTLPFLSQIDNQVIRLDYYRQLALVLDTTVEAIINEAEKLKKGPGPAAIIPPASETPKPDRLTLLEEYCLTLLLLGKKHERYSFQPQTFFAKRVYHYYQQWQKKKRKVPLAIFVKTLPAELRPHLEEILLRQSQLKEPNFEQELQRCQKEIRKINLKQKLTELSQAIAIAEKENKRQLLSLEKKFQKISQQLIALEKE